MSVTTPQDIDKTLPGSFTIKNKKHKPVRAQGISPADVYTLGIIPSGPAAPLDHMPSFYKETDVNNPDTVYPKSVERQIRKEPVQASSNDHVFNVINFMDHFDKYEVAEIDNFEVGDTIK